MMSEGMVDYYKKAYPPGTRLQLDFMDDNYSVPSGTKGTVEHVDDAGTLHMKWDNGRSLGICPEVDSFHKIYEQEETQTESEDINMGGM